MNRAIYACDIGSVKSGNFAWARVVPDKENPVASGCIDTLVKSLLQDIQCGMSISLGFESPLFMPIPEKSHDLNRGRSGEGSRSMFAPAGAAVTTLGVQQVAWILRAIHGATKELMEYTLDWKDWPPQTEKKILFLWEAFVSASAHGDSHEQDAATAATFFYENESNLNDANAVTTAMPLCLIHACTLWAGWSTDLNRLHSNCLVMKPEKAYTGKIDPA